MTRKMMFWGWGLLLLLVAVTAHGWQFECQLDATTPIASAQIGDSWNPGAGLTAVNSWVRTETFDEPARFNIRILSNEGPDIYRHRGAIPSAGGPTYVKFQDFDFNLQGWNCSFSLSSPGDAVVKEGMQYPVGM
ncbi:hypothetical protein GF324_11240 [bacterium]|nr:hypothetical protein [bacterium]